MNESIEADLLAARALTFEGDAAAWSDRYVTARSRLDGKASLDALGAAARAAWRSHGWAHPAVIAHLEHDLGPLDTG
jgi:hypothetical protein